MSASNVNPAPDAAAAPSKRYGWLKIALIVSLALNLLFIGGGVARFLTHPRMERMPGVSQMQLIPRRFLGELSDDRRKELLEIFRQMAPSFREGRRAVRAEVVNLAAALEEEPYDPEKVKSVVEAFSNGSSGLITSGGQAALTLIERLTPEERKLLAKHIRLRDGGGRKKNHTRDSDGG